MYTHVELATFYVCLLQWILKNGESLQREHNAHIGNLSTVGQIVKHERDRPDGLHNIEEVLQSERHWLWYTLAAFS